MVQTGYRSTLRIDLTPMQLPEAEPLNVLDLGSLPGSIALARTGGAKSLAVYPGEPSEMVIQIENRGERSVQIALDVVGNFPREWCRVHQEQPELASGRRMDALLYFQIPIDLFERQEFVNLDYQQELVAGYRVSITVQVDQDTEFAQQCQEEFILYVRPRSLYLRFLPGIYREIDFIGRFLKIFEQAFEPVVHSLDYMWANLDPLTSPTALLPFLAHWVAWPFDHTWPPEQQRRLIRNAIELYRWRGTRQGLRLYLHLYTGLPLDDHLAEEADKHISITEPFARGFVLDEARLDEDAILDGGKPYHFVVQMRFDIQCPLVFDETLIRKIIDQQKPAFCTYDLEISGIEITTQS